MHAQQGFTLIELTVSLAVAGVLAGIAVPAVTSAMAAARIAAASEQVYATWGRATSHALVSASDVVICPARQGQCSGATDWSTGWIAFADIDGNRSANSGEPLILEVPQMDRSLAMTGTQGRTRLVVQSNGSTAGSNATLTLCDKRDSRRAIALVIANNGRIRRGDPDAGGLQRCAEALKSRS